MKPRESWGSRLGLLMATAGSAVGLGSLWKFPYVTGENGGGLFVIAYLVFTFLIGMPIFMAELLIGRGAQKAPVLALGLHKKNWRMVGWSCAFAALLVLSFYSVVAGWALNYTIMSLLNFTAGKTPDEISAIFDIMYKSPGINVLWTTLFLALTTGIVYQGIRQGIEFWSKILMPALFIILLLLVIYGFTLEGFSQSFAFIFKPRADKFSPSGLLEALGLACFTLSVGMGIIITYGSYMKKTEDITKTAITIASIDIIVSLLACLMIFPIIFTFGFSPEAGPGLLFKTMPVLFAKLPGTLLLSTVFFMLVLFAALTSAISVMEVLVATASEVYQWSRPKAALLVSLAAFILAIPSALAGSDLLFPNWSVMYGKNFFETIDYFTFTWLLPLNATFIAVYVGWILDKKLRKEEFCQGSTLKMVLIPWLFLVRWVVPVGVIFIILQQSGLINL